MWSRRPEGAAGGRSTQSALKNGFIVTGSSDPLHIEVHHLTVAARREISLIVSITNRMPVGVSGVKVTAALGRGLEFTHARMPQNSTPSALFELKACSTKDWVITVQASNLASPTVTLHVRLPQPDKDPQMSSGRMDREIHLRCLPYTIPLTDLLHPYPKQAKGGHREVQSVLGLWSRLGYSYVLDAIASGHEAAEQIKQHIDHSPMARVEDSWNSPSCNEGHARPRDISSRDESDDRGDGGQEGSGGIGGSETSALSSFHTAWVSTTWFGDYLAASITGHYSTAESKRDACDTEERGRERHARHGTWNLRIEFRSSSPLVLSTLTQRGKSQEVVSMLCGKHVTVVSTSSSSSRASSTGIYNVDKCNRQGSCEGRGKAEGAENMPSDSSGMKGSSVATVNHNSWTTDSILSQWRAARQMSAYARH